VAAGSGLSDADRDIFWMRHALDLARLGEGRVEPNPMVGCVVVRDDKCIGQGYHQVFGGPHAEVNALSGLTHEDVSHATVYVTLEPCSHFGKTPPCVDLLCNLRPARVVVAMEDPYPKVNGSGLARLRDAGIPADVGVLRDEAEALCAPYLKRVGKGMPWVIAKWAMTLDGKIGSRSRDSQWISNERSREIVHRLRGRVDAIVVGIGTALADDPMLTARPAGPRRALRVILDNSARLPLSSKLVQTAKEFPVLVACETSADEKQVDALRRAGCKIFQSSNANSQQSIFHVLGHLAATECTNVLVEGGGEVMGALLDAGEIDEVHAFIAPVLLGGQHAISPIGGEGFDKVAEGLRIARPTVEVIDSDVYVHGRIR
jgi:diaminohydroxyphosphoribosylaminopyrimidine deaminase / 5-amino-6-(5-phosphoribosylamino)uracil reductase